MLTKNLVTDYNNEMVETKKVVKAMSSTTNNSILSWLEGMFERRKAQEDLKLNPDYLQWRATIHVGDIMDDVLSANGNL